MGGSLFGPRVNIPSRALVSICAPQPNPKLKMPASIVIVDDEVPIQELLQVNLQYAGHDVACAGDADSAQSLIRKALPDLVLIDWMLPGTPGIAFARQLRQDARTRDVSIIMLTGRSAEQDRVAGLEAGADDYITKPFS